MLSTTRWQSEGNQGRPRAGGVHLEKGAELGARHAAGQRSVVGGAQHRQPQPRPLALDLAQAHAEGHVDGDVVRQRRRGRGDRLSGRRDAQLRQASDDRDLDDVLHLRRHVAEEVLVVRVAALIQRGAQPPHLDGGWPGVRAGKGRRRGGRRVGGGRLVRWAREGGGQRRRRRRHDHRRVDVERLEAKVGMAGGVAAAELAGGQPSELVTHDAALDDDARRVLADEHLERLVAERGVLDVKRQAKLYAQAPASLSSGYVGGAQGSGRSGEVGKARGRSGGGRSWEVGGGCWRAGRGHLHSKVGVGEHVIRLVEASHRRRGWRRRWFDGGAAARARLGTCRGVRSVLRKLEAVQRRGRVGHVNVRGEGVAQHLQDRAQHGVWQSGCV